MSYFDKCENCSKDFPERQYTWAWCDECLNDVECSRCPNKIGKELLVEDHSFCKQCLEEIKNLKVGKLARKTL